MTSGLASSGTSSLIDASAAATPLELRVALGSLLVFTALLPVQVWTRVPGLGASAAIWPADLALGVSLTAFLVGLMRGVTRLRFDRFGIAIGAYALCMLASAAASESLGRSLIRTATALACVVAALLTVNVVSSESHLRSVARAWLIGTTVTVFLGLLAVVLFYLGAAPARRSPVAC